VIILAIDPGQRSGWAVSQPALSGSVDHERAAMEDWWGDMPERGMVTAWEKRLSKEERLKRVLGTYAGWLANNLHYYQPAIFILERQKPFRGRSNTHVLEFRGVSLGVAGRMDLALVECPPEGWRKHLNGRAYDPAKDHQLAAELMLVWWQTQQRAAA